MILSIYREDGNSYSAEPQGGAGGAIWLRSNDGSGFGEGILSRTGFPVHCGGLASGTAHPEAFLVRDCGRNLPCTAFSEKFFNAELIPGGSVSVACGLTAPFASKGRTASITRGKMLMLIIVNSCQADGETRERLAARRW
jgi:hypothetical protein